MTHGKTALLCAVFLLFVLPAAARYCGSKQTCYEVLGVDKSTSKTIIRNKFRSLSEDNHPDNVPENKQAEAMDKFLKLTRAYDVLGDPESRKAYDAFLDAGGIDDDSLQPDDDYVADANWQPRADSSEVWELGDEKPVEATPIALFSIVLVLGITVGIPVWLSSSGGKKRKRRGLKVREGRDMSFAG